jgi:hypothetical protein
MGDVEMDWRNVGVKRWRKIALDRTEFVFLVVVLNNNNNNNNLLWWCSYGSANEGLLETGVVESSLCVSISD